jgi:glycosyltransferase involved in cell wall biosynthesis
VIQRAGCGLCVEPENPSALAGAILDLFWNDAYRTRLATNGREYVVSCHSKLAAAEKFHNLVRFLAGEENSPTAETVPRGRSV